MIRCVSRNLTTQFVDCELKFIDNRVKDLKRKIKELKKDTYPETRSGKKPAEEEKSEKRLLSKKCFFVARR